MFEGIVVAEEYGSTVTRIFLGERGELGVLFFEFFEFFIGVVFAPIIDDDKSAFFSGSFDDGMPVANDCFDVFLLVVCGDDNE